MKKRTTIYDIANALDVTVSTVSRALSNFPGISDATKKAVIEMAAKLDYRPNKLASALKSGKTYIIGVIVPSIQAHFFASIIHSIEDELKESGYSIIVYQSSESVAKEIKGVSTLLEAQVDGIMASLALETEDVSHFKEVVNQNKPLILFDRIDDTLKVPTVTLNDFKAGFMAATHLIERGYKKIAFVTTSHKIKIFSERLEGYKQALKLHSLPVIEEDIILGGLSIKDGRFGISKLLRNENRPDAIIAGDDFTALGIVKKLKEVGLAPPIIGVMGFANEVFSPYVTPSLSTVDQHPNQMGKECAKLFLDMIRQLNPYDKINTIVIEPTIVDRQSTGTYL
ncbi:LacI family DNA-binding transcriptional regulator [Pedobacter cryotolerans]|uniref:LacI family transcriptional regulator n=1 Tax=Pedobacter cryotolerans TaxID=2571270 RepID=A0A4U1BWC8_9SPHI|nr:LacI family DNA-binding transcriptional regulator [Pedobacter cryotolerans]TKB96596.1 LacI family transcriptional regulator [Pedobacter cryotolerans]